VSKWPKLTVVTPSLNQAQFLEDAISSVLDQNYPNLEYVIMDGGSTDGSFEIIRKYEKHLTYWTSAPDKGQTHAITRGFSQGSGEWLAWLNADDFYLPGAFKAFQEAFEQDQGEASLYFGTGEVLDQEKGVRRKFWPHSPSFSVEALIYGVDYIMQPTTFFKRTALEAVGGLCQHFHYVMDYDLWIRIGRQFKVEAIKHPIACSREHPASKTATGRFGRWLEIQRMIISYAGTELTPGLLDYLLQDVYAATKETSSLIAPAVRRCLLLTLRENAVVAKAFCSAGDWFPDQSVAGQETVETKMLSATRSHKSFFDQFNDLQRALSRAQADALARLQNAEELERLLKESEADRAARLAEIGRLGERLEESEADRAARLSEIEVLGNQLAESEADRTARLVETKRLGKQLAESEADRAARFAEMERLRNQLAESKAAWLAEMERVGKQLAESEADRAARFAEMERLRKQLAESKAARLAEMERLGKQLAESEADRAARLAEMERLGKQLAESEADRAARLALMERLGKQLAESEADRAARLEVIHRLEAELAVLEGHVRELEAVRNHALVNLLIKLRLVDQPKT
jgi:hypothetical protein